MGFPPGGSGVTSFKTRTGSVVPVNADYAGILASFLTGATQATRYVGGTATGAPASGTFAVGDLVVAQDGHLWVCTVAGTPGTWVNPFDLATYTWATLPIAGTRGSWVRVTDTLNGVAGVWPLRFRDDQDATYPWSYGDGASPGYVWKAVGNVAGNYRIVATSGWAYVGGVGVSKIGSFPASFDLTVPAAGTWITAASSGTLNETTSGDTAGVGISTTNSVAPTAGHLGQVVQAGANAGGMAYFTGGSFAGLASGATLYSWLFSSSGTHNIDYPSLSLGLCPTKVAGNV